MCFDQSFNPIVFILALTVGELVVLLVARELRRCIPRGAAAWRGFAISVVLIAVVLAGLGMALAPSDKIRRICVGPAAYLSICLGVAIVSALGSIGLSGNRDDREPGIGWRTWTRWGVGLGVYLAVTFAIQAALST